ncbi:hypothetical protein [Streptacidiphilus jiangxiensis]|uniref:Uncharacterized protein n=1 Tax=Streptacidiphilus jiangxiensis TaxID=235985 RepID=A0A1H7HLJ3_STRJI|nr:hypothetical protein [Streptacidiphilus jiangxiensis]SEK49065.1 hypothetical protein SAMN05414137_102194 [Streptacidiphilus jiangxiensis]
MNGGFGVAATSLWGRVARVRRRRWRIAQLLVALPCVPLLAYDANSHRPVATDADKFWHDASLPFLVLAVTLPLWRAPEEGLPDALRLRELHRRICRRAAVVLLLAASVTVSFDHWYTWHGNPAAANAAGTVGLDLLALAPVVWLVLEPLLWTLWPAPVRRGVRVAQTAEALYRPRRRRSKSRSVIVPEPVPGGITDFDADQGASGRPRPHLHEPARARSADRRTAPARGRQRHQEAYLHWDGAALTVCDGRGRVRTVPLADTAHPGGVAELVWLSPRNQLLFLDRDGYRLGRTLGGLKTEPGTVSRVSVAAGLAFNAYQLSTWNETRAEQSALLFPRRPLLSRLRRRAASSA